MLKYLCLPIIDLTFYFLYSFQSFLNKREADPFFCKCSRFSLCHYFLTTKTPTQSLRVFASRVLDVPFKSLMRLILLGIFLNLYVIKCNLNAINLLKHLNNRKIRRLFTRSQFLKKMYAPTGLSDISKIEIKSISIFVTKPL